jgi:hypothetical protein
LGSWQEDFLDHRHLLAAYRGLFFAAGDEQLGEQLEFETSLVAQLSGGAPRRIPPERDCRIPEVHLHPAGSAERTSSSDVLVTDLIVRGPVDLRECIQHRAYPEFGLYVLETSRLHLVIRCGPIGQNGIGGHAHNDQLSVDLVMDGEAVFVDSGTFLYTPFPQWRNRFRSTLAHSTINVADTEQNEWSPGWSGLFSLNSDRSRAHVEKFGGSTFCGMHKGFGVPVRRQIELMRDRLRLTDEGPHSISARFCLAPGIAPRRISKDAVALDVGKGVLVLRISGKDAAWHVAKSWVSPCYGEKTVRFDLVGSGKAQS